MEFLVGDHSGLCKELSWLSSEARRNRIIKKTKHNRSLAVTALCWSGPLGGYEVSEVAVGRACGTVEAFATSNVVCEAPVSAPLPGGGDAFDTPLRSFQLPSTPVALSLIGSKAARAHTRSLLCKAWLGSGVTSGEDSLRAALLPPAPEAAAGASADEACNSSATRLLFAVGQKGHACVVEWEGSFTARLIDKGTEPTGIAPSDAVAEDNLTDVSVCFLPVGKEPTANALGLQGVPVGSPQWCRAAYLLPSPVNAASSHPLCNSLLAFGGKENDAKVVDLDYGKILWGAKNVKPSFLGLRCEVAVTQIEWLLSIHPMVLVVGTARGALRFYDLRCQRRPVLEVCEATQEKRPITALRIRPTAEVLQTKTDIRVVLARAAESAAIVRHGEPLASPPPPESCTDRTACSVGRREFPEGPRKSSTSHSYEDTTPTGAEQDLLRSCSGKNAASVYYADSYGMVYGVRVVSGASLLRLADKSCPKYNPSSYRSLEDRPEEDRSAKTQRKLIASMLGKQRERLTSKKNDHPIPSAACTALQLAAVPSGGFKGAMGAIVGLALDPSGERLIAVGLGRHAYVFDTKSRKLCDQVFLKQKLTCVLAGVGIAAGGVRRYSSQKGQQAREASSSTDITSSGEEHASDSDNNSILAQPNTEADNQRETHAAVTSHVRESCSVEHSSGTSSIPGKRRRSPACSRAKRKRASSRSSGADARRG